jgi:hypothetical protein
MINGRNPFGAPYRTPHGGMVKDTKGFRGSPAYPRKFLACTADYGINECYAIYYDFELGTWNNMGGIIGYAHDHHASYFIKNNAYWFECFGNLYTHFGGRLFLGNFLSELFPFSSFVEFNGKTIWSLNKVITNWQTEPPENWDFGTFGPIYMYPNHIDSNIFSYDGTYWTREYRILQMMITALGVGNSILWCSSDTNGFFYWNNGWVAANLNIVDDYTTVNWIKEFNGATYAGGWITKVWRPWSQCGLVRWSGTEWVNELPGLPTDYTSYQVSFSNCIVFSDRMVFFLSYSNHNYLVEYDGANLDYISDITGASKAYLAKDGNDLDRYYFNDGTEFKIRNMRTSVWETSIPYRTPTGVWNWQSPGSFCVGHVLLA